jgi:hypothetical protein
LYISIFTVLGRWEEVLNWMAAIISQICLLLISSWVKFYLLLSFPKIFELCHIFKGSVSYLCIMILPCILVMRQHVLSFLTDFNRIRMPSSLETKYFVTEQMFS